MSGERPAISTVDVSGDDALGVAPADGEGDGSVPRVADGKGDGSVPRVADGKGDGSVPRVADGEGDGSVPRVADGNESASVSRGAHGGAAPLSSSASPPVGNTPLLHTALSLFVIAFVVWVIYAVSGYRETYSASHDGWRVGGSHMIEITLVQKDRENLSCASDQVFDGLHCQFDGARKHWPSDADSPKNLLQPFNTVKNELFVAAGLWQSLAQSGTALPSTRFTVVCNYQIVGVAKTAHLRWSPTGKFEPLKHTVPVGRLTDCVIPQ